jgi:hypothetical protein
MQLLGGVIEQAQLGSIRSQQSNPRNVCEKCIFHGSSVAQCRVMRLIQLGHLRP